MKSELINPRGGKRVAINVSRKAVYEAADRLSNWGRWGGDDQIGTLNYVKPEDIVSAASLVRRGKIFALGIPLDQPDRKPVCLGAVGIPSIRC